MLLSFIYLYNKLDHSWAFNLPLNSGRKEEKKNQFQRYALLQQVEEGWDAKIVPFFNDSYFRALNTKQVSRIKNLMYILVMQIWKSDAYCLFLFSKQW